MKIWYEAFDGYGKSVSMAAGTVKLRPHVCNRDGMLDGAGRIEGQSELNLPALFL